MQSKLSAVLFASLLLTSASVWAAPFKGRITGSTAVASVVALGTDGTVLETENLDNNGKFNLDDVTGNFTLVAIDENNRLAGPLTATCSPLMKELGCKFTSSKIGVGFKKGDSSKRLTFKTDSDGFFNTRLTNLQKYGRVAPKIKARANSNEPLGTGVNRGIGNDVPTKANKPNPADADRDGLDDAYDADTDHDGIINNYDTSDDAPAVTGISSATADTVKIFSNLKLEIDQSLNANTGTAPTTSEIDAALSSGGTLAIAVVGDSGAGDTTELDCGALNYCSAGGTGSSSSQEFPENFDSDADGLGTVVAGGTGDFQLTHGATSAQIGGGDTFMEVVTDLSSNVEKVPGMLNFVFHTTPALKSLAVEDGSTYTVAYPVSNGMVGSANNCFLVDDGDGGDVVLTITGWRPQRPGESSLGEAAFMDIGKSTFVADIPNLPCSNGTSGGCSGTGPGNCAQASYSTTDPNLTITADGLVDLASDATADASNTFTFTLNLTTCLGATSFNADEKVFIDLQSKSEFGDNAAQKFCVKLP